MDLLSKAKNNLGQKYGYEKPIKKNQIMPAGNSGFKKLGH